MLADPLWELNRLMRWFKAHGIGNALYSVNEWGFVDIHCVVAKPDPNAYKPAQRTFRPLTDPSWESAVPACLDLEALAAAILPRTSGEVSPKVPQGACALATPNTS